MPMGGELDRETDLAKPHTLALLRLHPHDLALFYLHFQTVSFHAYIRTPSESHVNITSMGELQMPSSHPLGLMNT